MSPGALMLQVPPQSPAGSLLCPVPTWPDDLVRSVLLTMRWRRLMVLLSHPPKQLESCPQPGLLPVWMPQQSLRCCSDFPEMFGHVLWVACPTFHARQLQPLSCARQRCCLMCLSVCPCIHQDYSACYTCPRSSDTLVPTPKSGAASCSKCSLCLRRSAPQLTLRIEPVMQH